MVVTKSDFIVSDMMKVINYIEPAFYARHNIFLFFQSLYKEKFIEMISSCLENSEAMKDSYGNLLVLLQFIDKFEKML